MGSPPDASAGAGAEGAAPWLAQGRSAWERGDLALALEAFDRAAESAPASAVAHAHLAALHWQA